MDWPFSTFRLLDQSFGQCISPEDTILPYCSNRSANYFRPWKLCSDDSSSTIENTKDTFRINLDVQHFKPNEINVKVNDREVIIEGKHEDRQDEHGFISRQFVRRYSLPKECAPETVTSTLSSDGVLIVAANKMAAVKNSEKIVPITMCGPCQKEERTEMKAETSKTEMSSSSMKESQESASSMMEMKEAACSRSETDKKQGQILMEDHCRLMNTDILKDAASSTDKILSESRKETDELLKLMSSDKMGASASMSVTTERVEEALQQCKTAMSELVEKVAETSISSEMSSFKSSMMSESSKVSESFESTEVTSTSGKSTSMLSESIMSLQGADMKLSELVSEAMSELREAAENS